MSFLKKAFSKRALGHTKDSSLSISGLPTTSESFKQDFGYFENNSLVAATLDYRDGLSKPKPPFYSLNGRQSANGSSSSRIGEELAPVESWPRRELDDFAPPAVPSKSPTEIVSPGNPWATPQQRPGPQYAQTAVLEKPSPRRPLKSTFNPSLANLAGLALESPPSDLPLTASPLDDEQDTDSFVPVSHRHMLSMNPYPTPITPSEAQRAIGEHVASPVDDQRRQQRKRRPENASFLQAIAEAHHDPPPITPTLPITPVSPDDEMPLAKRLEERARQARLQAASCSLIVPEAPRQISRSSTPFIEPETDTEQVANPEPEPLFSDPPLPPSKVESDAPETHLESLQVILERTLRELQQAKEENERLQIVQGRQERDQLLIERLQEELSASKANPRLSYPPPPKRPPPPPPVVDSQDSEQQLPGAFISTPQTPESETGVDVAQLQQETIILRKQLASSKVRLEALVAEKEDAERTHREESIDFLQRLKAKQQSETGYLREIRRLTTERDLSDVRVDSIQLEKQQLAEDRDDILQQLKFQVEENQRLEDDLKKETADFATYKSQMREKEVVFDKLSREKAGWQAQIDLLQHKLSDTERRVRSLDNLERHRHESRQEGGYGAASQVGRSALLHHSPLVRGPSVDVTAAVSAFNQEVMQAAWMISDIVERIDAERIALVAMFAEHQRARAKSRAKLIWGEKMTALLEKHSRDTTKNDLLMLTCLEIFITYWCSQIIEGWYPYRPSFSDVLIQLVEQKSLDDYAVHKVCGKHAQVIRTGTGEPEFDTWIKEMSDDLLPLLRIAGVRITNPDTSILSNKLLPIIKLAYNIRLALAERDICGGLQLAAPLPDTPFDQTFMDSGDAGKKSKRHAKEASSRPKDWTSYDVIAGTKAIGLKRCVDGQVGQYEMVVLPQVMLLSDIEAAL